MSRRRSNRCCGWEKDHLPNLTGTVEAWRPKGSISRDGERPHAVGDYQAWRPE